MSLQSDILEVGKNAVTASRALAGLTTRKKNAVLEAMADELDAQRAEIQQANAEDLKDGKKAGLNAAMLDRLELTDARMDSMSKAIRDLIALKDPVGNEISSWIRPNGLEISKIRVPIGVIGIIYESRPNVTADAASLCIKTSNAVILKGGSEAMQSNQAVAKALQEGGGKKGLPENAIQLIATTDRNSVKELVKLEGLVDVIIPRGGEGLIRMVMEHSRIPVIKHYKGVCHTYVDDGADLDMALEICVNAKVQRPGVCNAMETLLIHEGVAAEFLPRVAKALGEQNVELRGDSLSQTLESSIKPASEEDWTEEYLDLILSIRIVKDVRAAVSHINKYGSRHSDAIVSQSESAQKIFTQEVDSATVYINASTRFTDGGEFGLGAEIGVSTDKLHARGPMGLEELTTYKYVILGKGQVRE